MSSILFFFLAALGLILTAGWLVFRLFRRRPIVAAISAAGIVLLLALLWPIPIHGGFTFLGEVLYSEIERSWREEVETRKAQKKTEFAHRLETRFAGTLDFEATERITERWHRVLVEGRSTGILDSATGMLWSEWLVLPGDGSLPALSTAKDRCRAEAPPDHWALAGETENFHLWKSGGPDVLPAPTWSIVSYLVDEQLSLEMPTYQLRGGTVGNAPGDSRRLFAVRCVARSAKAPPGGYARSPIRAEDWNLYQLSKLGG